MNVDNLESRLVDEGNLDDLREQILCVICCRVLTEDRCPMECSACQNQLFCEECITQWQRQKNQCPCCRSPNAEYEPANPIFMNIVSNIRFYCANKERGCEEKLQYRYL